MPANKHRATDMSLLGRGIYSVAMAGRLTGLKSATVSRYLRGYSYERMGERRYSPPGFRGDLMTDRMLKSRSVPVASFLDLLELRWIGLFRRNGVTGNEIRRALRAASEVLGGEPHPFTTGRFMADCRKILTSIATLSHGRRKDESRLCEIVSRQGVFERIIEPFIVGLTFDSEHRPESWEPAVGGGLVVLNPHRRFGKPITKESGKPTAVIAATLHAWGDVERVAEWYRIRPDEVEMAGRFEDALRRREVA
jgi:hypothetical protein